MLDVLKNLVQKDLIFEQVDVSLLHCNWHSLFFKEYIWEYFSICVYVSTDIHSHMYIFLLF